uniref:Uncharacterized protein n=2 Tax=Brassica campestris TaxID=3711 RepID=M4F1F6_BRACM
MADHLRLKIEPLEDSFTFVDHSTRNSGGIIRDLEVHIGNALVPVDFHVLENKQNKNHSLLLRRAFMATVGTVCNMQTNQLCLTLINSDVHYDPVRVDEFETEYSRLIDSGTPPSIDIAILPLIYDTSRESIDNSPANETFALPTHCYPNFEVATQPKTSINYHYSDTLSGQGGYSIGIWADESFSVDTALPEMQSDEYDEDYHRERNIEYRSLAMDDRGILHTSYAHTTSTSIDSDIQPSIHAHHRPNSKLHVTDNTNYDYLTPDEFGIFRVKEGQAREMDGRISTYPRRKMKPRWENIKVSIPTALEQNSYNKAEIDELVAEIYRAIKTLDDYHSKRLDDIYLFDNSISWLTACMDGMKQDVAMIQKLHVVDVGRSTSSTTHARPSIKTC